MQQSTLWPSASSQVLEIPSIYLTPPVRLLIHGTAVTVCPNAYSNYLHLPRGMQLTAVLKLKIVQIGKQLGYTCGNKGETYYQML